LLGHKERCLKSDSEVRSDPAWVDSLVTFLQEQSGSFTQDKQWQVRFYEFCQNIASKQTPEQSLRASITSLKSV
jgi:hypothetical protein